MHKSKKIKAVRCKKEDFGGNQESWDLYKDWPGYLLYCPDPTDNIQLKGEPASMVSTMLEFRIEKCI